MGTNSKIPWCDHTWNPFQGCTPVSTGCRNCYMFREKRHWGQDPTIVVRSKPATFNAPLRSSWIDGDRIFVCSWSDFFHPAADDWRDEAWDIMRKRSDLRFLILTKRIELAADRLPENWGNGWPNVWLGVTAENQAMLVKRGPLLIQTPAAIHFVSCEPLLEGIDNSDYLHCGIDWWIIGAESGPNRRPTKEEWARRLIVQCKQVAVPVFYKQAYKNGKKITLPMMDGKQYAEHPQTINRQSVS